MSSVASTATGNTAEDEAPAPPPDHTTIGRQTFLRGRGGDRSPRDGRPIDIIIINNNNNNTDSNNNNKKIKKTPFKYQQYDIISETTKEDGNKVLAFGGEHYKVDVGVDVDVDVGVVRRQNRKYDPTISTTTNNHHKLMASNNAFVRPPSSSFSKQPSRSSSLSSLSNNHFDTPNNNSNSNNNNNNYFPHQHDNHSSYTFNNNNNNNNNKNNNNSSNNTVNANNSIILWALIGAFVILALNMIYFVYKPLCRYFKCIFSSENPKMIERRYSTIDKWLVRKVSYLVS